LSNQQPHN